MTPAVLDALEHRDRAAALVAQAQLQPVQVDRPRERLAPRLLVDRAPLAVLAGPSKSGCRAARQVNADRVEGRAVIVLEAVGVDLRDAQEAVVLRGRAAELAGSGHGLVPAVESGGVGPGAELVRSETDHPLAVAKVEARHLDLPAGGRGEGRTDLAVDEGVSEVCVAGECHLEDVVLADSGKVGSGVGLLGYGPIPRGANRRNSHGQRQQSESHGSCSIVLRTFIGKGTRSAGYHNTKGNGNIELTLNGTDGVVAVVVAVLVAQPPSAVVVAVLVAQPPSAVVVAVLVAQPPSAVVVAVWVRPPPRRSPVQSPCQLARRHPVLIPLTCRGRTPSHCRCRGCSSASCALCCVLGACCCSSDNAVALGATGGLPASVLWSWLFFTQCHCHGGGCSCSQVNAVVHSPARGER